MPGERTTVLSTDVQANIAEADRLQPGDGAAWLQMMQDFEQVAPLVLGLLTMDLASPQAGLMIRQLMLTPDGKNLSPFAAQFLQTARDVLEERFQSDIWRGMLAPWVLHVGQGPDSANSGFWVQLVAVAVQLAGMPTPVGGSEMLSRSLVRLIEDHGGLIRTNSPVTRILVKDGQAIGVRTAGDEQYHARRAVIASTNPDQLYLTLLADTDVVPPLVKQQAARYRYGRGCMQIHLALSEPPRWSDDRLSRVGQFHITSGLDGVSRAVNKAVRGFLPADPTISIDVPTAHDPSRAPQGQAIVRLQLLEVPFRPRGDAAEQIEVGDGTWTEDLKNRLADRVMAIVSQHVPNLPGAILGRTIIAPSDLVRFNPNLQYGDPYAGSHELAQNYLFSPLPSQPSHRTVVPNLFLLGAATWPGSGVSGGSGYIVAQHLLQGGSDH
jgi:phytoene dehydrogenase-like protein